MARLDGVSVQSLGLPPALRNALHRQGIYFADRLNKMTNRELMSIPRVSIKSVKQIREALDRI